MKAGLWLPLFDDLADPRVCADLAREAEEAGWDGVFVWDNVRWLGPVRAAADPWITLAAIATATQPGPDRPRGDTACPPSADQGRAGDGDPRPAQRRPAGARGGPGQ